MDDDAFTLVDILLILALSGLIWMMGRLREAREPKEEGPPARGGSKFYWRRGRNNKLTEVEIWK
jgi:hypothetical protein